MKLADCGVVHLRFGDYSLVWFTSPAQPDGVYAIDWAKAMPVPEYIAEQWTWPAAPPKSALFLFDEEPRP